MENKNKWLNSGYMRYVKDSDKGADILFSVGFFIIGLMMAIVSINWFNSGYYFIDYSSEAYHIGKIVIATICLVFGYKFLKKNCILVGTCVCFMSLSAFIFSLIGLVGSFGIPFFDFLISLPILLCSIMFLVKKDRILFIWSLFMFLGLFTYSLLYFINGSLTHEMFIIGGITFGMVGIISFVYGAVNMIHAEIYSGNTN